MNGIGIWIIILAIWLIPKLLGGKKKKGNANQQPQQKAAAPAAQRQSPSVQLHRPVPSMNRPAAKASAHRDFSAPEAPCIVCEQTGEDHFQRDKARRIAQLDDWLKIGLIDRDEYRVMRDRYERGI